MNKQAQKFAGYLYDYFKELNANDDSINFDFEPFNKFCNSHLSGLNSCNNGNDSRDLAKRFQKAYDELVNNYANWIVSKYSLRFETKKMLGYMDDLSTYKFDQWNNVIKKKLSSETQYVSVFPHGNEPFLKGSICERVESVKALSKQLKYFCQENTNTSNKNKILFNTWKDVYKFHITISKELNVIDSKSKEIESEYISLKNTIKEITDNLIRNYTLLINTYNRNPEIIAELFDFTILFNQEQSSLMMKEILSENEKPFISPEKQFN